MANFIGTAGNDSLIGTDDADNFDITQGGTDSVAGRQGDDVVVAGATFDALDSINGQGGYDRLEITGNYAAGVTFGSTTMRAMEEIRFGAGFSYKIVTHDATVAAGSLLKIDGYSVPAGQSLYFDGSAETDGSFIFYDGQSTDTFIGGAKSDTFSLGYGGADSVYGGGGGDVISANGAFSNANVIDGGGGSDVLYLRGGEYAAGLAISASAMKSIETLGVSLDFVYTLSVADGVVAAGKNLYVTAEGITGSGRLTFNGAAETDGTFSFRDSVGDDDLRGGANNDTFLAVAGGSESFQGNGGDDTFAMYGTLDATDEILGGLGNDWVSLDGDYSGGVVFDMFTISGVESLSVTAGHDYKLTTDDANVGPDKDLYVQAGGLGAANFIDFDGSAETDGNFQFFGGAGNDIFRGGAGDDYLDAYNGGDDTFLGGAGDDAVSFFGAYTTDDYVDGGDGDDRMYLYGNFAGGLTLGSRVKNVESLTLGNGFSYKVTALNSLVAAGATMAIDTYYSEAGENFIFNGSAETNGHFRLTGGNGDDRLIGGSQSDEFSINRGGNDIVNGGSGDDVFWLSPGFTVDDRVRGGSGDDSARLSGDLGPLTFGAQTFDSVENFYLFSGFAYTLTSHDDTVAAGAMLTVDGRFLGAADVLSFDGAAETDGRFTLQGGDASDILSGGAMNDIIEGGAGDDVMHGNDGADKLVGGAGADDLYGGAGNDKFVLADVGDSTVAAFDRIRDWNAGDKVNLAAIDADTGLAGDQAFTYIGSAAFSGVAGELRVTTSATTTFIKGDIDGNGSADFLVKVAGLPAITGADFVL